MPAPTASQIESVATGAMQSAGLEGENATDLAKALAQVTADALNMFFGSDLEYLVLEDYLVTKDEDG